MEDFFQISKATRLQQFQLNIQNIQALSLVVTLSNGVLGIIFDSLLEFNVNACCKNNIIASVK